MAQKYIVNDIVMYKNRIHTIIDISSSNGYKLSYVRHQVSPVRLSGVPLTPEILEKNGWKKEAMSRGVSDRHLVYTKPDIEEYGYFPIYIEKRYR